MITGPLTPNDRRIFLSNIVNRARQLTELPTEELDRLDDAVLDTLDTELENAVESIGYRRHRAVTGEELSDDVQGTEYVARYLEDAALAAAQDAAPTGAPAAGGRFVIRYEPGCNPRLNDPRLCEALELALTKTVMTSSVARNEVYGNLTYYVGFHRDPEVVIPDSPDFDGDGETYLEALRVALGDLFGNSDLLDRAHAEFCVIDAYSHDDEVIATRPAVRVPGRQY